MIPHGGAAAQNTAGVCLHLLSACAMLNGEQMKEPLQSVEMRVGELFELCTSVVSALTRMGRTTRVRMVWMHSTTDSIAHGFR